MLSLDALLASVQEWAQRDENVLALILTGSTARGDGRRDEFSDLDVELVARDPQQLLDDDAWFEAFGEVWVAMRFDELAHPTRLVVYEGGRKVDFTVAGVQRLEEMAERLDPLYEGGYRVLVDKAGLADDLPPASGAFRPRAAPLQSEFDAVTEEFWFEAMHLPGYLARGELWVVKFRDWTMKEDLLKMLEWHAVARSEAPVDVRYIGTRMKEWVDEAAWRQVHDVFGRFDAHDAWRALLATVDLFSRIARETADASGLTYPEVLEQGVRGYLAAFDGRFGAGLPTST